MFGDIVGRSCDENIAKSPACFFSEILDITTVAERIRQAMESSPLLIKEHFSSVTVTISVGGTRFNPVSDPGGLDIAMAGADRNLYEAKREGRNRVCV